MAPEIDVPPPKSWRGARATAAANALGRRRVPDAQPRHHVHLQRRPGPLHHGDGDRLLRAGADCIEHALAAERRHVAVALKLEAGLVDAPGHVDREHELQVNRRLRPRRRTNDGEHGAGRQAREPQRRNPARCRIVGDGSRRASPCHFGGLL
jgi:hypothetical protein